MIISASQGNYDIYVVFLEKGLNLLKKDGRLGFILPHKFFNAQYGESLRNLISQGKYIEKIIHFGYQQVFTSVSTYTCLLFLRKSQQFNLQMEKVIDLIDWKINNNSQTGIISHPLASASEWNFILGKDGELFERLKQMEVKLENVTDRIFQGIKTSADKIYIVQELARQDNLIQVFSKEKQKTYWLESNLLHPLIKGGDSKRYNLSKTNKLIIFPYENQNRSSIKLVPINIIKSKYPLTWNYLLDNKIYLENREKGKMLGDNWYGYVYPKALDIMSLPKLFTPDIATVSSFTWDKTGKIFFTGGVSGGYGILVSSGYSWEYILGLLNSKVLEFYVKQSSTSMRGGYYSFESRFIHNLPIRIIDNSQKAEKNKHDLIVNLVETMLSLHQQLNEAQTPPAKKRIQQQINATDRQINQLVYELYGLTDRVSASQTLLTRTF
ncbi:MULTISPECIES: Eco57I restriction-modification methylase domain-containing protein [unclassified Nostoc]|uniref:Eco57I restriction-modification methylase domain-containing protein n=1 Tax=unclassified Nostoc TaxID=2593658 RepID=UPI0026357B9B|nr:TaqI-like C-terminal specificity domain-containing protein [Nostoc sp. S13]